MAICCQPLACPSVGCQVHPSSSALPSFQQEGTEQAPSLMVNLRGNPACAFLFNQYLAFWTKVQYPKSKDLPSLWFQQMFFHKGKEQGGKDPPSLARKATGSPSVHLLWSLGLQGQEAGTSSLNVDIGHPWEFSFTFPLQSCSVLFQKKK